MKNIKLRIVLILLMLVHIPFSCVDMNTCVDLDPMPYYRMMDLVFDNVELYYINEASDKPMPLKVSQEYDTFVYPCDSLMLSFKVPDTALFYHSQNNPLRKGFGLQEAYACNPKRAGYKGTFDVIDKIHVTSNYDFDETHLAGYDLSDIVDIFAYTLDEEEGGFWNLNDYNNTSPRTAPKRFYLLFTRNARLSDIQQFVVIYHLHGQGGTPREFRVETPVLKVKVGR